MNDIKSKLGLKFPEFTLQIEAGKVREFALAIGDENPLYFEESVAKAAGFRNIPMPLTYGTVIDHWGGFDFMTIIKELEMNPLNVLHGEMGYEYLDDICVGDKIVGQAQVIDAETKKNMDFVTIEINYTNQYSEKVLLARLVVIERKVG